MVSLLLVLVVVLQTLLFSFVIGRSDSIVNARSNTYDHFNLEVQSAGVDFGSHMAQRWGGVDEIATLAQARANEVLARDDLSAADVTVDSDVSNHIIQAVTNVLLDGAAADNEGIFLVLADGGLAGEEAAINEGRLERSALYIRDSDLSGRSIENSDLLLAASPVDTAKDGGIALDSDWQVHYVLPDQEQDRIYFNDCIRVSDAHPALVAHELMHWSVCSSQSGSARPALLCTVPLRDGAGKTYGVLGMEFQLSTITSSLLHSAAIDPNGGTDASLALTLVDAAEPASGQANYQVICANGPFTTMFVEDSRLSTHEADGYVVTDSVNPAAPGRALVSVSNLNIYDDRSPYLDESWAIVGFERETALFRETDSLNRDIVLSLVASLLFSVVVIAIVVWFLTTRINLLVRATREAGAGQPLRIERSGIREFDELAGHLERYSRESAQSLGRLARAMRMTGQNASAFERVGTSDTFVFTDDYADMIGLDKLTTMPADIAASIRRGSLTLGQIAGFNAALQQYVRDTEVDGGHAEFLLELPDRWIRQFVAQDENGIPESGCVIDVTEEMVVRQQLEKERDHDILTGLLNRRAFEEIVRGRLAELQAEFEAKGAGEGIPADAAAAGAASAGTGGDAESDPQGASAVQSGPERAYAVAMIDLDNLKGVNDGFGHDVGDRYIKTAAESLERAVHPGDCLSRISGDEFMLFITSATTKADVLARLKRMQDDMAARPFQIRGGFSRTIGCSVGVAFAPQDGRDFDELKAHADAAMYAAKHAGKATIRRYGER